MNDSLKTFINKKILIYGLGKSGLSSNDYLKKKNKIFLYDDNKKNLILAKQIKKIKFDAIIISPGIDIKKCKLSKFLKKNLKIIYTDLDVFYSFNKNQCITITGTNGKSTTCSMLYEIFKLNKIDVRLVGNIGNPPLLEKKINDKTIFIIEASSYQIFYSKYFKTDYAVILNLSVDHLERHGSMDSYAKAKLKLIFNQDKNKQSYVEKNNLIIKKNILKKNLKSKINKINYNKDNFFKKKIKNIYLLDQNNLKNIHFIYTICKKFKFSDKKIFKSLNNYKGLKFRKQIIYNNNNIKIINDSKSTSFSSTTGLLTSYKNIYWIVGGKHKKGDRFELDKKYYKNIFAYIIGLNKNFFAKQFRKKIKFKYLKNIEKTLLTIKNDMRNDKNLKTILFSPSAASFDQFQNFEDRGEYFNKLVNKIIIK